MEKAVGTHHYVMLLIWYLWTINHLIIIKCVIGRYLTFLWLQDQLHVRALYGTSLSRGSFLTLLPFPLSSAIYL
jgi:hypothetical protein